METLAVFFVAEGLIIYINHLQRISELEVLKKWKSGTLSYREILALKAYNEYLLRKLNKQIKMGKYPGDLKKEN